MDSKKFILKFKVRGYELDAYGHVNNAVYLNYCEYARWCLLEDAGVGADYFKNNNVFPVIARAEIDYKAPCFLAEEIRVESTLLEMRKKVAVMEQKIIKEKGNVVAAIARMTMVVVGTDGRAVILPADFGSVFGVKPIE